MESTGPLSPPDPEPEISSARNGEKRAISTVSSGENGEEEVVVASKKVKYDGAELSRVAEIVLVLAAMGRMRGGKDPTAEEVSLMAEARERLVSMIENFSPKDIVESEAVGRVMEDLGLNGKVKDQRLGFKVPKLSIAEKITFAKRKMEESRKFPSHPTTYAPPTLQPNLIPTSEGRGTVYTLSSDKSSQALASAGVIPLSTSVVTAAGNSASVPYQSHQSDLRSNVFPSATVSGNVGSMHVPPKVERTQDAIVGGSTGMGKPLHFQVHSSANQPSLGASMWSAQNAALSARPGPENTMPTHALGRVDRTSNLAMPPHVGTSRPFRAQTTPGHMSNMHHQTFQGANFVSSSSSYSNHYDIAKIVQKFTIPKAPERPTWTPPSREYMTKALTCQLCQLVINDVESVLICDACEKGYHLKCLQSVNQRTIPKAEWHCPKCLVASHGKPLPPKYGRVMRNVGAPKVSSTGPAHSSLEKKVGVGQVVDVKAEQLKVRPNGSSAPQNPPPAATVNSNHVNSSSDSQIAKAESQGHVMSFSGKEMDRKPSSESAANNMIKHEESGCDTHAVPGSSSEKAFEDVTKSEPSAGEVRPTSQFDSEHSSKQTESVCHDSHQSPSARDSSDIKNSTVPNSDGALSRASEADCSAGKGENCSSTNECESEKGCDVNGHDRSAQQPPHVPSAEQPGHVPSAQQPAHVESSHIVSAMRECAGFCADVLHSVEWSGDVLKTEEGKMFYQACCIEGVAYKLKEHVLFRSNQNKMVPFKLQAMWEDNKTGLKWVQVSRCYFPGDLPNNASHPFAPDSNEVFESNHDNTLFAGLIQGPCEVLPPAKYTERHSHLGTEVETGSRPVFICKWFYDELKGHFQAIST